MAHHLPALGSRNFIVIWLYLVYRAGFSPAKIHSFLLQNHNSSRYHKWRPTRDYRSKESCVILGTALRQSTASNGQFRLLYSQKRTASKAQRKFLLSWQLCLDVGALECVPQTCTTRLFYLLSNCLSMETLLNNFRKPRCLQSSVFF